MKKCIFILPYFGEFKNYFQLFLDSCGYNAGFNWLIITDSKGKYVYPENVKVLEMDFGELRQIIQRKFDFPISLKTPYKLCDFKPAYGYVFEEYIQDYQYWGHCDCDLIFGDLSLELNNLLAEGYDKLFAAGHLTIYRNTVVNNRRFMLPFLDNGPIYRSALSRDEIFAFDEMYYAANVHMIFKQYGFSVYENDLAFNASTDRTEYCRKTYNIERHAWTEERVKRNLLYWYNGKIIAIHREGNNLLKREFIYLHLQGRSFNTIAERLVPNTTVLFQDGKIVQVNTIQSDLSVSGDFRDFFKRRFTSVEIGKAIRRFKRNILKIQPIRWREPWNFNPYKEF